MGNLIGSVDWIEKNEDMDDLLNQEDTLVTHPMDHGFEAEVIKISSAKESFVLKVWNKSSKPDIHFQFRLLNVLFEQGLTVSKPLGWGINANGNSVLVTTFDGTSVKNVNEKKMIALAKILASIHQIHVGEVGNIHLPKYNFIDYFFPGVKEHADIYNALIPLIQINQIKQERIIHGDFHLGNIVEKNGRYTVIDWTNGQLGDPRYDFAWSFFLKRIYLSEQYADVFRSAYLLGKDIQQQELEVFEALACIRWILLNRNDGVPKGPNTMERVKILITNNPFLRELKFKDFGIKSMER